MLYGILGKTDFSTWMKGPSKPSTGAHSSCARIVKALGRDRLAIGHLLQARLYLPGERLATALRVPALV
jgi:hypothetical protein